MKRGISLAAATLAALPLIYGVPNCWGSDRTASSSALGVSAMDTGWVIRGGSGKQDREIEAIIEQLRAGEYATAYQALVPLHEKGVSEASRLLALLYLNGDHVEKDRDSAIRYLLTASENGNKEASFALANLYYKENPLAYATLQRLAAEQGHLIAAQQIALAYHRGEGVSKAPVLAYKWFLTLQLRGAPGQRVGPSPWPSWNPHLIPRPSSWGES